MHTHLETLRGRAFDRAAAIATLLAVALLVLLSALQPSPAALAGAPASLPVDAAHEPVAALAGPDLGNPDLELYARVRDDVAGGDSYYTSVVRHHRELNFPLRPFYAIRPPALAYVSAALATIFGAWGTQGALVLLVLAAAASWRGPIPGLAADTTTARWLPMAVAIGTVPFGGPRFLLLHECWAAALITLSLGLWMRGRIGSAAAAGLAAGLVRDLAIPYLLVMAAAATLEKRWREAGLFTAALAVACGALALHAHAVDTMVLPGDLASQGWNGHGGWAFVLDAATTWSAWKLLPTPLGYALTALAFAGWALWRSPLALRASGLLAGYALLLAVFARPANHYWAVLIATLLPGGLVLAPAALAQFVAQAFPNMAWRRGQRAVA